MNHDDLAENLAQWRDQYAKIGKLIAAAEAILGEGDGFEEDDDFGEQVGSVKRSSPNAGGKKIAPDEFVGMSATDAVRAYLEKMGKGNPQGPQDMARAFVEGGREHDPAKAYNNVREALKRLSKNRQIKQVRRGMWGLMSWYPNSGSTVSPKKAPSKDTKPKADTAKNRDVKARTSKGRSVDDGVAENT